MQKSTRIRKLSKLCFIPQRYLLAFMIFLGTVIGYELIMYMSVFMELEGLSSSHTPKNLSLTVNRCNFTLIDNDASKKKVQHYTWLKNHATQLSKIFAIANFIGHFPAGYMADKYGGKHVFGFSVLFSGLLSMLMAALINLTESVLGVKILRFFIGLAAGGLFPSSSALQSSCVPKKERGTVAGIIFAATPFSIVIKYLLPNVFRQVTPLNFFHIYGGFAVIWWLLWLMLGFSNPQNSYFMSDKEIKYLSRQLSGYVIYKDKEFPFFKMLKSLPLWAFVIAQVGHVWIYRAISVDLPRYLMHILNFDVHISFWYASLPYLILTIVIVFSGFVADILTNKKIIGMDHIRKIFTILGGNGPAVYILAASFSGCERGLTITMFSIAMGLMGFYYSGTRIIALDIAPNYSGLIMALGNGLGVLGKLLHPYLTAMISLSNAVSSWRKYFLLCLVILMLSNLFFVIFGTSKEQSWNNTKKHSMAATN